MKFQHLEDNDQTYTEHFKDAFHYSFESFKCSVYFLMHAIYPDSFKTNGSNNLNKLMDEIKEKYIKIKNKKNGM